MSTNSRSAADPRIEEALQVIYEYARGNLRARGTISAQNDDMDALITGINVLGEESEAYLAERRRAEERLIDVQEELVRKEKLSMVGRLSGSVGHELRSPLAIISNAVYFLKTVLPEADEIVKEYLGIIKSEVENAERIISDLLDFSRAKTPLSKRLAVEELIKSACGRCTIRENVTLQFDMPDTGLWVHVDPLHMEQVFRNLITNGVQAMPGGGVLTLRAKPDGEDESVRISISDTGEGIAPENMKLLFQPLFTTKARGIGLGLVVSRNLVEANGGRIEVESHLGAGTTFTVILPAAGR